MVEIRRILCPVDFSEFSHRALAYAVALATWFDAELTVLHVVHAWSETVAAGVGGHPAGRPLMPGTPGQVTDELGRSLQLVGAGDLAVRLAAEAGETAPVVLAQAAAIDADLVVLGTHGRSGIDGLLLGSMAAKIVAASSGPVLTVPRLAAANRANQVLFKTILCAVDFSPSSLRALSFALALGREAGGTVTLLHVIESFADEEPRAHARFDVRAYRRHLEDEARARLQALVPGEARAWCEVDEIVSGSKAHQAILRQAGARRADLLVLGAQGDGGFGLFLFGSTTEHVLRRAACPVLTVRAVPPSDGGRDGPVPPPDGGGAAGPAV
jgi:nucleotide-binding universal stress UspA family protein